MTGNIADVRHLQAHFLPDLPGHRLFQGFPGVDESCNETEESLPEVAVVRQQNFILLKDCGDHRRGDDRIVDGSAGLTHFGGFYLMGLGFATAAGTEPGAVVPYEEVASPGQGLGHRRELIGEEGAQGHQGSIRLRLLFRIPQFRRVDGTAVEKAKVEGGAEPSSLEGGAGRRGEPVGETLISIPLM